MRRSLPLLLASFALAACGSDSPTGPTGGTVTPPTASLASLAAAKGKSFGAALDAVFFNNANASYNALVAKEFNMVVAGNVMKWGSIHRDTRADYRWASPDAMVAFAQANNMKVRGHTLAWHQQNPQWLTGATWTAAELQTILGEHIDAVVGHYKGKIYAWDVVNEALADNTGALRLQGPWAPTLGQSYIDLAFQRARAADPSALLFYNDYGLEFPGNKQDSAFALLQGMKARTIPVDGIGFQAHFQVNADGTGVPSKQMMMNTFSRFIALGLKVELTELDIRVRTPGATAAELTAQTQGWFNVVSACVDTPGCDAIVVWGVHDAESWIPSTFPGWGQALLFDDALGKKAGYNSVKSALGG